MLTIILILILVGMCIFGAYLASKSYDWDVFGGFTSILTGIASLILMGLCIVQYDNLIKKESEYRVMDDKLKIQDERRVNTVNQLKVEMLNYVSYERGVFDSLKADNVSSILFKFPELRTIESVKILMEEITKLNNGYYGMVFAKKDYEAYFESVNNNKFIIVSSDFDF